MTLCTISRAISRATGGRPGEMLCSRAYRNGWLRFVAIADAAAFALWGERDHCRNCYKREAGHG